MTQTRTYKGVARTLIRAANGYFVADEATRFLNQLAAVLEGASISAEGSADNCGPFRTTTEAEYAADLATELMDLIDANDLA